MSLREASLFYATKQPPDDKEIASQRTLAMTWIFNGIHRVYTRCSQKTNSEGGESLEEQL
jgi:hypothetical protein